MSIHGLRPRRSRRSELCALCLIICTALLSSAAIAGADASPHARSSSAIAVAARMTPRPLITAARLSTQTDRVLVSDAKHLKGCLRVNHAHPKRCNAARRALQLAGGRHEKAERRLSRVVRSTSARSASAPARSSSSRLQSALVAPQLTVSGQTLTWTRVANINTYVFVRKVPGQAEQYSVVKGTSTTPPPVPGVTVSYSVRTTASGSAWAAEQSITYPSVSAPVTTPPVTAPAPEPVKAPDTQAAPQIVVSGQTLAWNAVAGVSTYVLVTKVPGQAEQYSEVSGTSITPPAVPGVTASYSVRTAVEGSAWAPEVTIAYPATQPTSPPAEKPASPPAEETASSSSPLQIGLNSGTEPADFVATATLGAKLVRLPFAIEDTPAQLKYSIEKYAAQGVRVLPLAYFTGRIPTPAEAQNLASWVAAYGPGGTFWAGRSDGNLAIQSIEFGNETSYSYQFPQAEDSPSGYAARAQAYALRFAEAAKAVRSVNPGVGLLAQGDAGNAGSIWIENMFKAVPNLGQLVAGWTIHPYGPNLRSRVEAMIKETAAQGAPSTIPVDITEWGLSTDNGRCVTENYGWPTCMTYQEASEALTRTVSELRQVLNGRPGMFLLYTDKDWHSPGTTNEREAYFGALQYTLQPKGAYTTTVEAMLANS